jgi:hypothetical protein
VHAPGIINYRALGDDFFKAPRRLSTLAVNPLAGNQPLLYPEHSDVTLKHLLKRALALNRIDPTEFHRAGFTKRAILG